MKKKILTILLAAMALTLPGCSSDTESGSEKTAKNITIDQTTDSDGKTGEEADEQEAGEMQAAADAIDKVHAEKKDTLSDTSVDQGGLERENTDAGRGAILGTAELRSW